MSSYAKRKPSKLERPKTELGLPDLDHGKSAVLDSLRSPESKRGYRHAIDEFIQAALGTRTSHAARCVFSIDRTER